MTEPPVPAERLSPAVRTLWRLRAVGLTVAALVAGAIVRGQIDTGWELATWLVPLGLGVPATAVLPGLRYRRWRFAVEAERIDLRHGGVIIRRTLIPMRRVQHVDTHSGALEQLFDLATVTVHTAGGSVAIPGIEVSRCWALQRRIADLAGLTGDD